MKQIVPLQLKKSLLVSDPKLNSFLKKSFTALNKEFSLYLNYFPNAQDIFKAEERTLLGLWNNSIVRSFEDAQTYQEYGSYIDNKFVGRADLFVMVGDLKILVEAKKENAKIYEYSIKKYREELGKYWKQAKKYYREIKKMKPYLMTLVFWPYKPKNSDELDLIKKYNVDEHIEGIFYYTAYLHDDDVLMIYGRIG